MATATLGTETLNGGEREGVGMIKPAGWRTKKFADIVADRYVYNRCHLLMQAAAAGMQKSECNGYKNLITGTRYLNVDGMLPYESEVLSYIQNTGNHVAYRVTPIYKGEELVARGVQMEAYSVEDQGKGVKFNVYCYNVQPGIDINYKTGSVDRAENPSEAMSLALKNGATSVVSDGVETTRSNPTEETKSDSSGGSTKSSGLDANSSVEDAMDYVLNTNTRRFHYPTCNSVNQMKDKNKKTGHFSRQELIDNGYKPCGNCKP